MIDQIAGLFWKMNQFSKYEILEKNFLIFLEAKISEISQIISQKCNEILRRVIFWKEQTDKFENIINRVLVRYYQFWFGKPYRNFGFGNFSIYPLWSTTISNNEVFKQCEFTIMRLTFWSQNIQSYKENSAIPSNSVNFGTHPSIDSNSAMIFFGQKCTLFEDFL